MLTAYKLKIIHDLIKSSSKEELVWLNGYLSGIIRHQEETQEPVAAITKGGKITITYGTETGNSKRLAAAFAAKAKKNGIQAKLVSLDQYRLNDLGKEEFFFTVISTQGEGEPPAAARKFYDHIHQSPLRLDKLKFGVLALGDTSYPLFCKAGEDVDIQLQQLGGQRIVSLQRCDVDYEQEAVQWFDSVLRQLGTEEKPAEEPLPVPPQKTGTRAWYQGRILSNVNLNDRGSAKQTHHIELSAEQADYLPGDSLGIIPENPPEAVEAILKLTGIDAQKKLHHKGEEFTVYQLLKNKLHIFYLPERVVKKYAAITRQDIPQTRIGLTDLLKIYPVLDCGQFEEVMGILEPIAPRLYSISSSPLSHAGEIHLTVARDSFEVNGELKHGLCSDMLCRIPLESTLNFYIHPNKSFRLPAGDKDIIMVGPGTGIAPFRSFLAERDAAGATGRNWLFFGDQHFQSDFLYQTEWQNWKHSGVLTRISLAFSRDRKQKVYVQHKMQQEGDAIFEWLESGASFYVCGAREPMSTDVDNCLLQIIGKSGNRTPEESVQYLEMLKEQGRYLRDVY